ncbi:flagellar filament capping protein FliD, partial [Vibrio sp. 10N.222.49.C9]
TGGDTEERGLLANDSTVRGIARNLESLMRGTFEGVSLYQVGIEIGRDGKVSVDADRFDDALLNMDVETILNGPDGLFKSLEDTIKGYSNSSTGDIQRKLDTLS